MFFLCPLKRWWRTGCLTEKLTIMYSSPVTFHDRRVTTSLFFIGFGQIPAEKNKRRRKKKHVKISTLPPMLFFLPIVVTINTVVQWEAAQSSTEENVNRRNKFQKNKNKNYNKQKWKLKSADCTTLNKRFGSEKQMGFSKGRAFCYFSWLV